MKAAQINGYGDPSVMQINEMEIPELKPKKVLVEVYASSLNPFDTTVRKGFVKETMPLKFPATLGGDIAGVIAELGEAVDGFSKGDKIYGQASVVAGNSGAFAEFAATSAKQIARMPKNLDFNQAASLPLVGVSALQAISEHINLVSGQKIFIHGGAGGIGTIAIQIAKHLGAYVATTATADGMDLVKSLGADQIIDYKSEDFSKVLSGFDAVFDTVGGSDFNKSFDVVKKGGVAVSMIAQPDEIKAEELGITAIMQATKVNTEKLNRLTELVENGAVTPQVSKVFQLDNIKEAFEARENGLTRAKIVIAIKSSSDF
ncbi:MAG TPA: NADP-dependent oxidoreductase [Candidatus Saccharimonadales bacterium]|nr:NADP-dependent oxidoreductase [Candidatus Saccharimonadales bacterium]